MKWYVKSLIQNGMAILPDSLAQPLYFQMQTRFGELRNPLFDMRYTAAMDFVRALNEHHDGLQDKRVLELGTGRFVDVPMALWLMGAGEIVTIDLSPLLRGDLVGKSIEFLREGWDEYREKFAEHCDPQQLDERYDALCRAAAGGVDESNLQRVLDTMKIEYRSPADGSQLDFPDECFDLYVSFVTIQHIPPEVMAAILKEGQRLLKRDGGRMLQIVNTSDHFSHVDSSLSPINFLRYSERRWQLIGGNRFMYQNRLRADDYYRIFREVGLETVVVDERVNERALEDLRGGFPLHTDWRGGNPERDAVIRFQIMLKRDDATR